MDTALQVNNELDGKLKSSKSLGKSLKMTEVSQKMFWTRETYFNPPRGVASRTPTHVRGASSTKVDVEVPEGLF